MKDPKFIKGFVPSKSKAAPQDVIVTGPGANVIDLYEAGAKNGVVTIGGFSPTVGAAGGYVLGGGAGTWALSMYMCFGCCADYRNLQDLLPITLVWVLIVSLG